MTDDELTKRAWETIELTAKKVEFPPNVSWRKTEIGEIIFTFNLSHAEGDKTQIIHYPPIELIKDFMKYKGLYGAVIIIVHAYLISLYPEFYNAYNQILDTGEWFFKKNLENFKTEQNLKSLDEEEIGRIEVKIYEEII